MRESKTLYKILVALVLTIGVALSQQSCEEVGFPQVHQSTLLGQLQDLRRSDEKGGQSSTTFYALSSSVLYKSTDNGASFTDQSSLTNNTLFTNIYTTVNSSKTVFLSKTSIWYTNNGGASYIGNVTSVPFTSVIPHPSISDYLLATQDTQVCYTLKRALYCYTKLFISTNFGGKWSLIADYATDVSWDVTNNSSVIYRTWTDKTGDQASKSPNASVLSTYNVTSNNSTILLSNVVQYAQTKDVLLALQVTPRVRSNLTKQANISYTFVVKQPNTNWSTVKFPGNLPSSPSFTLLDSQNGLTVSVLSTVYVTDTLYTAFSSVLENYGMWFHSDTLTLVNVVDKNTSNVRTFGTKNKGGSWNTLKALSCVGCSLQLDATTALATAGGLVLANGNIGNKINDSARHVYLSRDAGNSWEDVYTGFCAHNWTSQGSILVMSPTNAPTEFIRYSLNQLNTTTSCMFTNSTLVNVTNIIASTSTSFILIASDLNNGNTLLFHLDFTGISNQCNSSDYEQWNLTEFNGNPCVMGQQNTYLRRKRSSTCLSNVDTSSTSSSTCDCSVADFTCDFCYSHSSINSSTCSVSCSYDPSLPPQNCTSTYSKTQGYRLVPGTKCTISSYSRLPTTTPCPSPPPHSDTNKKTSHEIIIAVIVACIFILGCCTYLASVLIRKKLKGKSFLPDFLTELEDSDDEVPIPLPFPPANTEEMQTVKLDD